MDINAEKLILINALREDAMRTAIVARGKFRTELLDCDFDHVTAKQRKGDILVAEIKHIENSLAAAFADTGSPAGRHAFLPFKEISPEYYSAGSDARSSNMKEKLKEGLRVLVQIDKEERGKKGAALTTYISLAGCYLVLMPNNPRAGGISRRIEGEDRDEIKSILNQLTIPEGMGLIVRTAGVGREIEELQWDLDVLLKQWETIQSVAFSDRPAPFLLHQESDIVVRTIRDYLRPGVSQILVDNPKVYARFREHLNILRPEFVDKVTLYEDKVPLFNRFEVESQIESAFTREVRLPSGGSVVIDHTEALTSIDVNSGRSTGGEDIEATALHTNVEAAQAIATQLRLRDIGGLVVIDFIDMTPTRNQREVENCLRKAVKLDRARVQLGRISRFGLLEMSRQRLRPSLEESHQVMCPRCNGQGSIRGVESLSASIIRLLEEEAMRAEEVHKAVKFYVQVPLDIATYLMNEKRSDIQNLDERYHVNILIMPNSNLQSPQYKIDKFEADVSFEQPSYKSFQELDKELETAQISTDIVRSKPAEPAIKHFDLPEASARKPSGFITRMINKLMGEEEATPARKKMVSESKVGQSRHKRDDERRGADRGRGRGRQGRHKGGPKREEHGERHEAKSRRGSRDAGRDAHRETTRESDEHRREDNRRPHKSHQKSHARSDSKQPKSQDRLHDQQPQEHPAAPEMMQDMPQERPQREQKQHRGRGRGRAGDRRERAPRQDKKPYEEHATPEMQQMVPPALPQSSAEAPAPQVNAPAPVAPVAPVAPAPTPEAKPVQQAPQTPVIPAAPAAPKVEKPAAPKVEKPAAPAPEKPKKPLGSFQRQVPMMQSAKDNKSENDS